MFKLFTQQLCEAKIDWDEPLTGEFLKQWEHLLAMLKGSNVITIPQLLFHGAMSSIRTAKLVGFCDTSLRA